MVLSHQQPKKNDWQIITIFMIKRFLKKLLYLFHGRFLLIQVIVCGLFSSPLVFAGGTENNYLSKRFSIAVEFGNWQPHTLNDNPSFNTFGAAGATPYAGFALSVPLLGDLSTRFSIGYWSLRDLEEVESVHSLIMLPLCLDFKYYLVPDNRLSAYVTYGGGIYWGVENETFLFGDKLREARAGLGVSLGAGVDVVITKTLALGIAFQYHYVRFKKPLGGVDDFSGPKITGILFFFL